MELHVHVEASRPTAVELARLMLGEPAPDDEPTLADLLGEVANMAAGAMKTALIAEGFPFSLGLASRVSAASGDDSPIALAVALRHKRVALRVALTLHSRNAALVPVTRLREGMVLADNLYNEAGALMLPIGTRLTSTAIARLHNISRDRPLRVCVPDVRA